MSNAHWYDTEDGAACLVTPGGDPNQLQHRVAFIEKTPRVRIRRMEENSDERRVTYHGMDKNVSIVTRDWLNWAGGPRKGSGPADLESREWCEHMLTLLGVSFETKVKVGDRVSWTFQNSSHEGIVRKVSGDMASVVDSYAMVVSVNLDRLVSCEPRTFGESAKNPTAPK